MQRGGHRLGVVAERGRRDLLRDWTAAMQSLTESIGSATRQGDVARQVLAPMQRQTELFQEALRRERAVQGRLVQRAFAPLDAVFDLLEDSGSALEKQAEAVEDAARALDQVAGLMKVQAEMFGTTVRTLRGPTKAAKTLAGGAPRADRHDEEE
jgi:hypothetical protein